MSNKYLIGTIIVLASLCIYLFVKSIDVTPVIDTPYVNDEALSTSTEPTDYFARNQECLQMKDGLSERFETENSTLGKHSLEQIFYSPKLNTCTYVRYTDKGSGFYYRSLYDVRDDSPNSKPLEQCDSISSVVIEVRDSYQRLDGNLDNYYKDLSACDSFDSKLEEYKT